MWIIPKNLHTSAFVQDTEALISDYQELSDLSAQSLLARSKPSPAKTWSRRWKTGSLNLHLFGRILKPSRGSSFAEKWTSSQEASLVSHLVPQGEGQETMIQDTFGLPSSEESESWHTLPLFSSRMLRGSSAQSSRAMDGPTPQERPFCSMSSASWKDWVTKQRQAYSQRVKSVRPISENECSLWVCAPISATQDALLFQGCSAPQSEVDAQPIPPQEAQSSMSGSPQESQWATPCTWLYKTYTLSECSLIKRIETGRQVCLTMQALTTFYWATPTYRDYKDASMHKPLTPWKDGKSRMNTMPRQVHNIAAQWSTPTTRDYKGPYPQWIQEDPTKPTRSLLPDQAHNNTYTGKLNPRWVETLMGLPVGWTMPSCADPWTTERMSCAYLGMESFPPRQSEPSESCGES